MKTLTIAAILGAVTIIPAFAEDTPNTDAGRNIPTSVSYVQASVNTKQPKIPRAGTNSAQPGTTVVTYTEAGGGQIGERGIYDGTSNYNATDDSNKLVTASALNDSVTNIPTITTSKLTCANSPTCDLWTLDNTQEVYGNNNNNNGD